MKKRNPSIHAKNRQELVLATRKAGRELSVYSTMFNTIIADRMGSPSMTCGLGTCCIFMGR